MKAACRGLVSQRLSVHCSALKNYSYGAVMGSITSRRTRMIIPHHRGIAQRVHKSAHLPNVPLSQLKGGHSLFSLTRHLIDRDGGGLSHLAVELLLCRWFLSHSATICCTLSILTTTPTSPSHSTRQQHSSSSWLLSIFSPSSPLAHLFVCFHSDKGRCDVLDAKLLQVSLALFCFFFFVRLMIIHSITLLFRHPDAELIKLALETLTKENAFTKLEGCSSNNNNNNNCSNSTQPQYYIVSE